MLNKRRTPLQYAIWIVTLFYITANITVTGQLLLEQVTFDDPITLKCSYNGTRNFSVFRWYLNDEIIGGYTKDTCRPDDRTRTNAYSVTCTGARTMYLTNVSPLMIGRKYRHKWYCLVAITSFDIGSRGSNAIYLRVSPRQAPYIKSTTTIKVNREEHAILRADVLSFPAPAFIWLKLTDTRWTHVNVTRTEVVSCNSTSTLIIIKSQPEDSGRYRLKAVNGVGSTFVQEYTVEVEPTICSSAESVNSKALIIVAISVPTCILAIIGLKVIRMYIREYRSKQVAIINGPKKNASVKTNDTLLVNIGAPYMVTKSSRIRRASM